MRREIAQFAYVYTVHIYAHESRDLLSNWLGLTVFNRIFPFIAFPSNTKFEFYLYWFCFVTSSFQCLFFCFCSISKQTEEHVKRHRHVANERNINFLSDKSKSLPCLCQHISCIHAWELWIKIKCTINLRHSMWSESSHYSNLRQISIR